MQKKEKVSYQYENYNRRPQRQKNGKENQKNIKLSPFDV